MFDKLEADIVVMQETKIQRKDLQDDMVLVPGWDVYFSLPKHKKGYSGVAIYTRPSKCCPIRAEEGLTGVLCPPNSSVKFRDLPPDQQIGGYPKPGQLSSAVDEPTLDSEGRCVILEFPAFVLIGVYSPATRDETRTEFREAWIDALDVRVRNLVAMGKQVFLCGDLNIIRSELDTAGLAEQLRREAISLDDFFSRPARRFFNQLVFGGRVIGERDEGREEPVLWDICREFHPSRTGMYTCWETRKNARPGNFGSRIDYVLCSSGIKDWFVDSNIQEGLLGSDHCPVYATLDDTVSRDGVKVHLLDVMNPEGMFKDGQRLQEWSPKNLLPTSAKLIPEFDKRRSIRDMFFKKPAPSSQSNNPLTSTSGSRDTSTPADDASGTPSTTGLANRSQSVPEPQPPSSQTSTSSTPFATAPQQNPVTPKRQAETVSASSRPQKRGKVTLISKESSKSSSGPTQRSLMGFFKPKTPEAGQNKEKDSSTHNDPTPTQSDALLEEEEFAPQNKNDAGEPVGTPDPEGWPGDHSKAESWSKLLGKRTVPKCEHGEDCQILTTKKAGVNCGKSSRPPQTSPAQTVATQHILICFPSFLHIAANIHLSLGRSFFSCSRPLGPTGRKEEGTAFRCGTFIWSSDWNGRQ
ncbi:putative DNA lyase apn2 protein [Lasiosphaeria ovina]|uniref:DNA lyase apn2 protein n=1 Tax=Lasiosphaeria ovina TaxID=92902 RepID=A0AAE0K5W4_9PEZI|nr:putative DNA lyase apn2 protein [Lasiosphaeria ovina]